MSRILEKHRFDLSDVRLLERLYGERLPDLMEPLRLVDADVEAIQDQLDQYKMLAHDIEALHSEIASARMNQDWQGAAAERADGFWDGVLTVLKWVAAIILYIVAALLMVLAFLLIVVGLLCELIGQVLSWVAAVVAVLVVVVVSVRAGGRASSGRGTMIWAALKEVFQVTYIAAMGIVGALGQGIGWLLDVAGRAVMWLALFLVEVGADLTGEPSDKVKAERDRLFG